VLIYGTSIDPGPDPDTSGSDWTFSGVQPNTTQYINMKAMVNGTWSQVSSWTVQVPAWVAPTDSPAPSPIIQSFNNESDISLLPLGLLMVIGVIASLFLYHFKINLTSRNHKHGKIQKEK